jgi:hypothetical protein
MSRSFPSFCSVIATTVGAHSSTGCCGCLTLEWVPDEDAWAVKCNECSKTIGWAKADWTNPEDRLRLGRDGSPNAPGQAKGQGSPSPRRLEDYDEIKAKMKRMEDALKSIKAHDGPGFPHGTCATIASDALASENDTIHP